MRRQELLISTERLADALGEPGLVVADVRFGLADPLAGERAYEEAHVPGAVYLDWYRDLSEPEDEIAGQLASPSRFREAMERAGIGDDTLVVAYDDGVIFMAARLVWCLRSYGHDAVRVLDGGLPKWRAEGRPLEGGRPPRPSRARFTPRPVSGLAASKEDVLEIVAHGGARLLDCRMDETWDAAAAHIPGAGRLPAPSLVDRDGTLLPPAELARRAQAAGVTPDDDVVLYCGGGISASLAFAALATLGYGRARVYDGSWSEWSADPSTPREPHGPVSREAPRRPSA